MEIFGSCAYVKSRTVEAQTSMHFFIFNLCPYLAIVRLGLFGLCILGRFLGTVEESRRLAVRVI